MHMPASNNGGQGAAAFTNPDPSVPGTESAASGTAGLPASSKSRYRGYVLKRRRGATDAPADEDPNHAKRLKRSRPFKVLFREFSGLLRGSRGRIAVCLVTVTLSALLALITPASTKIAIDYILTNNPGPSGLPEWVPTRDPKQLLWYLGVSLLTVSVLMVANGMFGRFNMTRLTHILRARIRRRVFNHAVRLPLHRVYQIKSGGAASMLREDAGQSADLLFSLMYNPWRAIVQLTGTLCILAYTDWRLLLGATVLIPLAWFSQKAWIARIRPVFRAVRATRTGIDAHATEAFGGMRVVRGFSRARGEAARFIRSNHFMSRQEMLAWRWSRAVEVVWMLLLPLGSVGVLVYGGGRVLDGTLTIGDVMMFSAYLLMLLGPLESLSASATSIQAELASLDRVLDLLAEPREFEAVAAGGAAAGPLAARVPLDTFRVAGRIGFENVSFRYPGSESDVLSGVSVNIPAGSTVALVGPSGAGKTTLTNLVARFYDPTGGRLLLDGTDVRTLDVEDYRSLLGIVEQDVFLFDGTIAENIGYARRDASLEEVYAAARAANAHEFILRLEQGYSTLVGERGVRLSGGQKQRIAIARALLADPKILILDEATSNLDSESEALIQQSLRSLMRGRTCFVIAHRLSTIRSADTILVVDHGRIVERGTHEELAALNGRYRQMLDLQNSTQRAHEDEWTVPAR